MHNNKYKPWQLNNIVYFDQNIKIHFAYLKNNFYEEIYTDHL